MTVLLSPNAKQQFFTSAGAFAAGYKLYTYLANSVTPQATYTNRAGTAANANPIILDARGEAIVYLTPGVVYDYVLKSGSDVLEWTREDVSAQAGDAASIVFTASGSGAAERPVNDKLREVELSITDYADSPADLITGTEAADTAWARAQAALPLTGGTIKFPRGSYRVTSATGLTIGNALASNPSTLNGVRIKGDGWGRSSTTMNANDAATRIYYAGTAGGKLINIQGPISGVVIEDLMLDGNSLAANLIVSQRSFHQSVKRVLGVNWTNGYALTIGADTTLGPTYGGGAPISHVYEQFDLQSPGVGACGVDIANGTGNVNQLLFNRCYLDRYNTTATVGVRLGYCDHIQFANCHIAQTGAAGSTGIAIQARPQVGFGNFPWNITLTGTAMAGGVSYDSSLQAWTNATYPALIFQPMYTADGAPVPPKSANAGADLPAGMVRGTTDNGIEFGWWAEDQQSLAATPTIAPKKRVILLADDDAVAANNLIATITPPRAVWSVTLGGYRLTIIPIITGTNTVRLVTGGNIAQQVVLSNLQAVELVYSEGTGLWSVIDAGNAGVWTPAPTNIANTSAITAREGHWSRVGNTVHFGARIEFTATAGADTASTIEFDLPLLPGAFGASWEAIGVGTVTETVYRAAVVIASGTKARVQWQSAAASAKAVILHGSYQLA